MSLGETHPPVAPVPQTAHSAGGVGVPPKAGDDAESTKVYVKGQFTTCL